MDLVLPIGILGVRSGRIGGDLVRGHKDDVDRRNSPLHADSLVGRVDDGTGLAHFNYYAPM